MKNLLRTPVVILIAAFIALIPAQAQDDCTDLHNIKVSDADTLLINLGDLSRYQCLGANNDKFLNSRQAAVLKWKYDEDWTIFDKRRESGNQFNLLKEEMLSLSKASKNQLIQSVYSLMTQDIDRALEKVRTFEDFKDGPYATRRWVLNQDNTISLNAMPSVNIGAIADAACIEAKSCAVAYVEAQDIVRVANLTAHVVSQWFAASNTKNAQVASLAHKQWTSYLTDTRTMSLLEMFINDRRAKTAEKGIVPPPKSQLIFLHPGAGVEYSTKGNQTLVPAITLEVIGYNYWGWKHVDGFKEDFGEMGFAVGVSGILNFSSREGHSNISYGGMLHLDNKYSISVTRGNYNHNGQNGHDWRIGVNVNLFNVFKKGHDDAIKYKAKLEKIWP